jgi:hypothetical protein
VEFIITVDVATDLFAVHSVALTVLLFVHVHTRGHLLYL